VSATHSYLTDGHDGDGGHNGYNGYDGIGGIDPYDDEASLGDLFSQLTDDLRELAATQVQLAKVELKDELDRARQAAAMLGAGALGALMALILLSFAAAWGLAEVMAPGWAFLIVGAVWAIAAAVLITFGRNRMRSVEAVPDTVSTMKEDVRWARRQMT
jgi:uncharacterized membrane protein YqjE